MSTLKKGDRVIVRNQTLGGESVVEGTATVVAVYSLQRRYRVHFDGDAEDETYIRELGSADKITEKENR